MLNDYQLREFDKQVDKKIEEMKTEKNKNRAKLQILCDTITNQTREYLTIRNLGCEANLLNAKATYKIKKKYTYIDQGGSGKYLINFDGEIYGIKAYGVINLRRFYGTLDTINEFYWGDYTAKKIVSDHKRAEYQY